MKHNAYGDLTCDIESNSLSIEKVKGMDHLMVWERLAIIRIIPYAIYINTLRLDLKFKSERQNNKNVGSKCRRIFFFF